MANKTKTNFYLRFLASGQINWQTIVKLLAILVVNKCSCSARPKAVTF